MPDPSTSKPLRVAAVIVAAGRGVRAASVGGLPKQYRTLGGRPAIAWSLAAFLAHPRIQHVVSVIHRDDEAVFAASIPDLPRHHGIAYGAATRQGSVRSGLAALAADPPDLVLVHDAARPFVTTTLIDRAIDAAAAHGAAVPGVAVVDTIASVDAAEVRVGTLPRDRLRAVQTPQSFRYADLAAAHRRAAEEGREDFTDDGAVMEWAGVPVVVFEGDPGNMKLTTADDLIAAERRLAAASPVETRTGTGYDVHAFGPGDHVMLCGLAVPHDHGLVGHSDADVALHAVTDAIFGALCDADIGAHFPPSDPTWKGAASAQFLQYALERVRARGGSVLHLDITVVCEAPRVGPHRDAMRQKLAEITGLDLSRLSVKATTSERLGFTGRREGIAAMAAATIQIPASKP